MKETFSVYSTETKGGKYTKHPNDGAAESSVRLAKTLTDTGRYYNVWIVCDQDDMTVFDWNNEEGVVFPKL